MAKDHASSVKNDKRYKGLRKTRMSKAAGRKGGNAGAKKS